MKGTTSHWSTGLVTLNLEDRTSGTALLSYKVSLIKPDPISTSYPGTPIRLMSVFQNGLEYTRPELALSCQLSLGGDISGTWREFYDISESIGANDESRFRQVYSNTFFQPLNASTLP